VIGHWQRNGQLQCGYTCRDAGHDTALLLAQLKRLPALSTAEIGHQHPV
jgi:hypothetical protein